MTIQKKLKNNETVQTSQDVTAFLDKARQLQTRSDSGRLIFALDATASRQRTWDRACHLQAQMFEVAKMISGLSIQLCYYRGLGEFRALPWSDNGPALRQKMLSVQCLGGRTQIERLLQHALREQQQSRIRAMVFVGDAMEEDSESLFRLAGQLGIHRLPVFMFQEGSDRIAGNTFGEIARLSGGVHCQFDEHSEQQLRDLLNLVAAYASGGKSAVEGLEKSALQQHIVKRLPRY
jgi:hypothetical protein